MESPRGYCQTKAEGDAKPGGGDVRFWGAVGGVGFSPRGSAVGAGAGAGGGCGGAGAGDAGSPGGAPEG